MSEKTMLDLGGLAFLEGDPLGLRELEESLVWNPNGPLPDWLDGADLEDLDDDIGFQLPPLTRPPTPPSVELRAADLAFSEPESPPVPDELPELPPVPPMPPSIVVEPAPLVNVAAPSLHAFADEEPPLIAELVETGPPPPIEPEGPAEPRVAEPSADDALVSINDILRFVEDPAPPAPVEPPPVVEQTPEAAAPPSVTPEPIPELPPLPARRVLGFDELIDARVCLLATVAGRAWGIPLDRVERVTAATSPDASKAVDLYPHFEGKPRRTPGIAIVFDDGRALIVDLILGPRSFAWQPLTDSFDHSAIDSRWSLAQTTLANQPVELLDWESITEKF